MAAIIIESANPQNLKLLAELAEKLGDKVNKLNAGQLEDLALGELMNAEKTGNEVSRELVFEKLQNL